jgi:hypothetical protein
VSTEKAATGASTARAVTRASTSRAAADIECGGLPWWSARLPYLAGGSPHGRIEQWRSVDPQEAARRSSIRHPGEEDEEEVVAGGAEGEETAGTSPVAVGSAAAKGGGRGSRVTGAGVDREEGGWDGGEERDTWRWGEESRIP